MKTLLANKLKDGWIIEIQEKWYNLSESDVYKIIRENGLIVKYKYSNYSLTGEIDSIIAD